MCRKFLAVLIVALFGISLWGCGSNRDSDSNVVAGDDTLANAATVGIDNCFTCHGEKVGKEWLNSRHANVNLSPDLDDPTCNACHDPLNDGELIDDATASEPERMVVGCESCHGGGQFHRGIGPLPFPLPGPEQCGECHEVTDFNFHSGVARNITDTHDDLEATTDIIEGYNVKVDEQTGCVECHYSAHDFDLTINEQWGNSAHAGHILEVKQEAADAGATAAEIKAEGVTEATGDAWVHYNWDDTNGVSSFFGLGSCQRCHTATGLENFLEAQANDTEYDPTENDFTHLTGWTNDPSGGNATASDENEMLYCWGCHEGNDGQAHDPGQITLDFRYLEDPLQIPIDEADFVTLPDRGDSNVCAACHSGRGNDTSIRQGYANAEETTDPSDQDLSFRFAGHHAPTAGSLYAETVHTGFEFRDAQGVVLDYTSDNLQHDDIDEFGDGPCVSCHMGGTDEPDHHFDAVTEDETSGDIIAIDNKALCDSCHAGAGAVDPVFLNDLRVEFANARQILVNLVSNTTTNYLDIDISNQENLFPDIVSINDYGAYQNSLYMQEEPCIRVHNSLYGQRLMFDSIDWLEDGILDGTINDYGTADDWLGGTTRP